MTKLPPYRSLSGSLTLAMLLLAPAAARAQAADPSGMTLADLETAGTTPDSSAEAPASAGGMASVVSALLSQARYWQAQNQPAQSLESLQRLLALDPTNTDALALRIKIELSQGDAVSAAQDLATLKQLQPANTQISTLSQMQHEAANPVDAGALSTARSAAQSGNYVSAIGLYQQAFHGTTPPPPYALEYYQTLAGTPNGYADAVAGLSGLVSADPSDLKAQLAFASVETYQPQARDAGISRLQSLTAYPSVAPGAASAWKQALAFLPESPGSLPQYQAYLAKYPNDAAIQNLVTAANAPQKPNPGDAEAVARANGFAALKANRLSDATRYFQSAISANSNDADALGGLGLVRLRQGQTGAAQTLLRQAIAADPASAPQWQAALDGASRGDAYHNASALIAEGELGAASRQLRTIINGGGNVTGAEEMLAGVQTRQGDAAGAEASWRQVLAAEPNNGPALVGLANLLEQQGDTQGAQNLIAQAQANGDGALVAGAQASGLRAQAEAAGSPAQALALYQQAVAADPSSPWARLDLARALRAAGEDGQARAQMDAVTAGEPSVADLQAGALFAEADGRPSDAAALVNRLPPSGMTPDMVAIQSRNALTAQIDSALAQGAGNPMLTRQLLVTMAAAPDPDGSRGSAIASALVKAGDPQGAQLAIQTAEATNPGANSGAQLAYAGAMMAAGQDATTGQIVQTLQARGGLTRDQQATLLSLSDGLSVRASDRLAGQGRLAAAYAQLAPGLAQSPNDPTLNSALGRLYQANHEPKQALAINEALLQGNPNNLDARQGAVDAAIAAGDYKTANLLVQAGQTSQPGEPRMWMMASDLARAQGDNGAALTDLRTAQNLREQQLIEQSGGSQGVAVASAAAAVSTNPFGNDISGDGAATDAVPSILGGQPGLYATSPSQADPMSQQISTQIASLQQNQASFVQGGLSIESRSGSDGLDKLTTFGTPLTATLSPRGTGQLSLTATPTFLNSGEVAADTTSRSRFGTDALGGSNTPKTQSASGVGINAAYSLPWLKTNIGATPFGFRTENLVGGAEIDPKIGDNATLTLAASRTAVTDSLLSYAGTIDPRSGTVFGGVVRNRINGQIALSVGPGYVYAGGGGDQLTGKHVAKNTELEFGAGGGYPVYVTDNSTTTAGVNVTYFSYNKNLRYFTLGQGGYFSPQSYFAATIPLDYKETDGKLTWELGGKVGVQSYDENESAYFPEDSALQSRLANLARNSTTLAAYYPSQSDAGIVGGANGSFEYQLSNGLEVGGTAHYDRTADYNDTQVLLYARYMLGGGQKD